MIFRFKQVLVVLAAFLWVSQPVLCDLRHMVEEKGTVVVHHDGSNHSHGHDSHGDHHSPEQDADNGESKYIQEAHHCCGGHNKSPVVKTAKCNIGGTDFGKFLAVSIAVYSLAIDQSPCIVAHFLIDMPDFSTSQGNPCALFCRWLI